jgi:hypothetical protein
MVMYGLMEISHPLFQEIAADHNPRGNSGVVGLLYGFRDRFGSEGFGEG